MAIATESNMSRVGVAVLENWELQRRIVVEIPDGSVDKKDWNVVSQRPDLHFLVYHRSNGTIAVMRIQLKYTGEINVTITGVSLDSNYATGDIQIAYEVTPYHPNGVTTAWAREHQGALTRRDFSTVPSQAVSYPIADAAAQH